MSSSLLRRETSAIISICVRVATGDLLRMKRIPKKKDLIAKRSDTKYRTVNVRTDDDRVHSVRRSPPAVIEP